MERSVAILLAMLPLMVQGQDKVWTLSAEEWARPRDGQTVSRIRPLAEAARALSRGEDQRLLIRYPGGEEGLLWAHELRSWLVALGIPLRRQELAAGSHQADRIELELTGR
jgi:hypothetical protein